MKKKALFLGGAYTQIPILQEAKNRGWYIITCDYAPDNPGLKLSDEYYNVSTTDKEKVLELAKKLNPDYVIAYASDPAAPVAAYVSEQLGLPSNSYESVMLLSEKDTFRSFLSKHGFNVPHHISVLNGVVDFQALEQLQFPVIVKPTDSSGSKGVSKVNKLEDIEKAVEYALCFSRNQRVIVEEFIDNSNGDIHGDGFVVDGELIFAMLGDHIYTSRANPYNPTGTCWPSIVNQKFIDAIKKDVSQIISKSGFTFGGINIEARLNKNDVPYVMEIGARNGGHFVPQAIYHATKVYNTVEGGALVCRSEEAKKQIDYLKNFGFAGETAVVAPGINSKMDELRAAYGLLTLKMVDDAIMQRKSITMRYREALRDVRGIRYIDDIPGVRHNYAYFPVFVDEKEYGMSRDDLYTKLKSHAVMARRYFYPLISNFDVYKNIESANTENLPIANKLANQVICLPLYAGMMDVHSNRVIEIIRNGRK